jgi:hypothetical protein
MALLVAHGGLRRFFPRALGFAAAGMAVSIAMMWFAQLGHDSRMLGTDEGLIAHFCTWLFAGAILWALWYLKRPRWAFITSVGLGGFGLIALLGLAGARFGLGTFVLYWAAIGATVTYCTPQATTARIPRDLAETVQVRARWVQEVMVQLAPGLPGDLQTDLSAALMERLMRPIWKLNDLELPSVRALHELARVPMVTREIAGEPNDAKSKAIYHAVLRTLLDDWSAEFD